VKFNRAARSLSRTKKKTLRAKRLSLQLETLEDRRLLATVADGDGDITPLAVGSDVGGTDGGVDAPRPNHAADVGAGVQVNLHPSIIAHNELALDEAFQQASNLQQYTDEEFYASSQWIVKAFDTTTREELEAHLGTELWPTDLIPNTYIYDISSIQASPKGAPLGIVSKLDSHPGIQYFYPDVPAEIVRRFVPNDPLFPAQWHLENTGQSGGIAGEDAGLVAAWDLATGSGVVVAVLDDAVQYTHPDLAPKYRADLSFDYADNDPDPAPVDLLNESHGTAVAGVAVAASNNNLGVAGAGLNAELAGVRIQFVGGLSDSISASALSHEGQEIDIYNASWGPPDIGDISQITPLTLAAIQQGVATGRGGLGSIYVWAGGNGKLFGDEVNFDEWANSRHTIAVAAIGHDGVQAEYSEPGAPILVTAHSLGVSAVAGPSAGGIVTTDLVGSDGYNTVANASDDDALIDLDYTSQFSGTSSATPFVSGILSLALEANPNLTHRDVQHVLVNSARQNDPTDTDWTTNGAGYSVNHKYGFGAIDAPAVVALAQNWVNVDPEVTVGTGDIVVGQAIPDNDLTGVTLTFDVAEDISLEWIELDLNLPHTYPTDIEVVLTSPSGTQSVMTTSHILPFGLVPGPIIGQTLTSARSWGESSQGTWTLKLSDQIGIDTGTIDSYRVNFFGTGDVPIDPSLPTDGGLPGVSGYVFSDLNGDGMRDIDEPYVAGAWVYVDVDNDGHIGLGEPASIADDFGRYHIPEVPGGSQVVRLILEPGWTISTPIEGLYTLDMTADPSQEGIHFGLIPAFDYGDAPSPYPTLIADDGPVHGILAGFHLGRPIEDGGVGVDGEADGQPIATDDNTNADDEDGVRVIVPFAPGATGTLEVTVSNGDNAAGFLNAWIDFNGNGIWDDSEQIATDLLLGPGVHNIDVAVPASANTGITYGRFRYSSQSGLAPTGAALSGEVEDHVVFILGSGAVAGDDTFSVAIDSMENGLDVLANDVPSIFGAGNSLFLLPPDPQITTQGGFISLDNNGTFTDTSDDQIRYTPPFGFTGEDTFTYQILDSSGSLATGMVTVNVTLADGPIVLDNTFRVAADSISNILDVLSNDLAGIDGPISISSFTPASSGQITIGVGSQSLLYTPNADFNGTDQFEYTVRDSAGNTDSGQVTLQVGDTTADDELNISFTVTDLDGNLITGPLTVGQTVLLNATVQDPRGFIPPLDRGVYSAYFDVLYDSNVVSVAGSVTFNPEYPAAQIFRPAITGLLDESGAFQDFVTASPLGADPVILFSVPFTAEQVGLVTFASDPADVLPEHESALNRPTVPNTSLNVEQIDFGSITLGILPQPDLVAVTVVVTDTAGIPISAVAVGDTFNVGVYAEDLREPFAPDHGVFSFYSDLLFDNTLVMVGSDGTLPGNIAFNDRFTNGRNAQTAAGVIDEAGAIHDGLAAVGTAPVLIYEVTFTAIAAGVVNFRSDPADDLPLRETSLQSSGEVVPSTRMTFSNDRLAIGAGVRRNAKNALDVNADQSITTLDVLNLVNAINKSVAGRTTNVVDNFHDVNGDGRLSPIDALVLINHINANGFSTGPAKSIASILLDRSRGSSRLADAQGEDIVQTEPVAIPPVETAVTPRKGSAALVLDVPADDAEISDDLAADILANWTR
jgi:subtilisin family serine protease